MCVIVIAFAYKVARYFIRKDRHPWSGERQNQIFTSSSVNGLRCLITQEGKRRVFLILCYREHLGSKISPDF